MFQLTVRGPDGSEKIYSIGADQGLVVGRDDISDIVLPSQRVSRRHARFFTEGTTLHLEDLGSQSGVFVGGARLANPVEIRPGPPIEIGEFTIRVKRDAAISASDYLGTLTGTGNWQGQTLTFPTADHFIVGREAPADLVIPDDSVSRKHAELRRLPDGSFVVRDLGSSNGTQINNARLPAEAERPLRPNDKVAFGETTWLVDSAQGGPPEEVQRSRNRLVLVLVAITVVVLGAIGYAAMNAGRTIVDGPARPNELQPKDVCLADVENEQFDKAVTSCQAAYDLDPIDTSLRKTLRHAQREAHYETIYNEGVQRENQDELRALEVFFQIDPDSTFFPKAKIEVDKILSRELIPLKAHCRDESKKKGSVDAIDLCTRYLNYTCHKKLDKDVLAALKAADPKKAADWKCSPELAPWVGATTSGPKADVECPKKYSVKEMADACVSYAGGSFNEAFGSLGKVKDADKSAASDMRDLINEVKSRQTELSSAVQSQNASQVRPAADALLAADNKLMPAGIESQAASSTRNQTAGLLYNASTTASSQHAYSLEFHLCAAAATYRPNYQGVSQCLQEAGAKLIDEIGTMKCDDLTDLYNVAPKRTDLYAAVEKEGKAKGCR